MNKIWAKGGEVTGNFANQKLSSPHPRLDEEE